MCLLLNQISAVARVKSFLEEGLVARDKEAVEEVVLELLERSGRVRRGVSQARPDMEERRQKARYGQSGKLHCDLLAEKSQRSRS